MPKDCSGVLLVASLKETRGVLWRVGGGITQGTLDTLAFNKPPQGAQGVLWRVAMSLRASCIFCHTHKGNVADLHVEGGR